MMYLLSLMSYLHIFPSNHRHLVTATHIKAFYKFLHELSPVMNLTFEYLWSRHTKRNRLARGSTRDADPDAPLIINRIQIRPEKNKAPNFLSLSLNI